jgi:hypothetical protein
MRRDKYEQKAIEHYEKTGETLLIAESGNARPVLVNPETMGTGKLVKRWEREEKGHARWI